MNIEHEPLFDTAKVEKIYSEKDGVDVKYVCTTDLNAHDHFRGHLMITNADIVESLEFGMIEVDGKYYYSQSHHDYKVVGDKMIDGGRQYIKSSGGAIVMRIINGKFIAKDVEDLIEYYQPGQDCQV